MSGSQIQIRPFRESDLGFAAALTEIAGWNQTRADWVRVLHYEPEGCFLATCAGAPAGTVTTTRYGKQLAWIGMMLVHPEFRRRGVATALMETSLEYLTERGAQCIKLDATPAGRPVYGRLGFKDEWTFHRWESAGHAQDASAAELKGTHADLGGLDHDAFGADRSGWLTRLRSDSDTVSCAGGFAMGRAGRIASYLGPVTANGATTAEWLIDQLLPHLAGRVFWDVPEPNSGAVRLAEARGFQPTRPLLRMWYGTTPVHGHVAQQFAIADPATG